MKTRKATAKSPGIPGWKWAAGLKPRKSDRFLWSDGTVSSLNDADLRYDKFPAPRCPSDGYFGGYIRRIAKPRKSTKPRHHSITVKVSGASNHAHAVRAVLSAFAQRRPDGLAFVVRKEKK